MFNAARRPNISGIVRPILYNIIVPTADATMNKALVILSAAITLEQRLLSVVLNELLMLISHHLL